MIDVSRVSKSYDTPAGPIAVLRELDLKVATGESNAVEKHGVDWPCQRAGLELPDEGGIDGIHHRVERPQHLADHIVPGHSRS